MGQITYKINTGTPNFTVHLEPSVSPDQVQTSLGIYSFTGLSAGTYNISITDSNGCIGFKNNIVVGSAPALEITFDDITYADLLIDGVSSGVTDWNIFFDLPASGTSFTSVLVSGNTVSLYGGSGITLKDSMFDDVNNYGTHLISFIDNANCVIAAGYDVFGAYNNLGCTGLTTVSLPACTSIGGLYGYTFDNAISLTSVNLPSLTTMTDSIYTGYDFAHCTSLTTISLPLVQNVSNSCFSNCYLLTSINLPSCTSLGSDVNDNNVFVAIGENTITLTVSDVLMSCNGGLPDGDIQTLQSFNIVNIIISTPALEIIFDDITYADLLINGVSSGVTDWNIFFDLPASGTSFTSVWVSGNTVSLYGGSGITLKDSMFDDVNNYGTHLISFIDNINCINAVGYDVFGADNYLGCTGLTTVSLPVCTTFNDCCTFRGATSLVNVYLPNLTTIVGIEHFSNCSSLLSINLPLLQNVSNTCFYGCSGLKTIRLPSCTSIGSTFGDDNVFTNIIGNTISLTIPSALMTCNTGNNPDGDIMSLISNNPLMTIILV